MHDKTNTSRLISYWLRHAPQDGNLHIDDFGWISTNELLNALSNKGEQLALADIIELSQSFDKVRWEFSHDQSKIRATHGHSIPVVLDEKSTEPPALLYHGTSSNKIAIIKQQGLLPMQRQFVHLSTNREVALSVGKRHGQALLIEVDTNPLIKAGWKFYKTSDNVWLTSEIPSEYLCFSMTENNGEKKQP